MPELDDEAQSLQSCSLEVRASSLLPNNEYGFTAGDMRYLP